MKYTDNTNKNKNRMPKNEENHCAKLFKAEIEVVKSNGFNAHPQMTECVRRVNGTEMGGTRPNYSWNSRDHQVYLLNRLQQRCDKNLLPDKLIFMYIRWCLSQIIKPSSR